MYFEKHIAGHQLGIKKKLLLHSRCAWLCPVFDHAGKITGRMWRKRPAYRDEEPICLNRHRKEPNFKQSLSVALRRMHCCNAIVDIHLPADCDTTSSSNGISSSQSRLMRIGNTPPPSCRSSL
jgi:hypothetical protein